LEFEEWQSLPAVRSGRVAITDGNKYFNRSSVASILGSAEIVAEFIHPELCGMYGHHGTRWVRLEELSSFCSRNGVEEIRKDVVLAEGVAESTNNIEQNVHKQESSPEHSERVKHVSNQIAALTRSDYAAAFAMNSAANQKNLVSAEKFEAIVSGGRHSKCSLPPVHLVNTLTVNLMVAQHLVSKLMQDQEIVMRCCTLFLTFVRGRMMEKGGRLIR